MITLNMRKLYKNKGFNDPYFPAYRRPYAGKYGSASEHSYSCIIYAVTTFELGLLFCSQFQ